VSVAIVGAAGVSARGLGWRGLGDARGPGPSAVLADTHPAVRGFAVPAIPEDRDAGDAKSRRLMSRSARLAAIAARDALLETGWTDRADVGYWLGCGASGGPLGEIVAMLNIAVEDGAVSLGKLGAEGLTASNPLHTFQVLNNFAMCHGAILEGTGGPNGAFFSRGAGTVHALAEAVFAIEDGDCERALAGGADTALHPVTWAELVRDGFGGVIPSEGAGILALARVDAAGPSATTCAGAPLAIVEHVAVAEDARAATSADLVVIAPWGAPARTRLLELAAGRAVLDVTAGLGESLAATPAIAWLVALDAIVAGRTRRAAILSLGIDGELGVVVLRGLA
jgi:hypothetical protein